MLQRIVQPALLSRTMYKIILAGFDNVGGQIYNIDLFGSITTEKFISTGSGSPVAYGYLESAF